MPHQPPHQAISVMPDKRQRYRAPVPIIEEHDITPRADLSAHPTNDGNHFWPLPMPVTPLR